MDAQNLVQGAPWFTNSTLIALVVLALVITAFRMATKNMQLVPSGFRNNLGFFGFGIFKIFGNLL